MALLMMVAMMAQMMELMMVVLAVTQMYVYQLMAVILTMKVVLISQDFNFHITAV